MPDSRKLIPRIREMLIARKRCQDEEKTGPDPSGDHDALHHCEKQGFLWRHNRETFEFAEQQQVSESLAMLDSTFDMPEGRLPSPMHDTDRVASLFRDYQIFMRIIMAISIADDHHS